MKRISVLFAVLFAFLFSNVSQAQNNIIEQTFEMINYQRKLNNLNTLEWNEKLAKAAKNHSNWMAKVGTMTHTRGEVPSDFLQFKNCEQHPVNRIIKSGYYPFERVYQVDFLSNKVNVKSRPDVNDIWGEIIAHGKPGRDKTYPYRPDIAVGGWMRSPGHKAQILKPSFEEMGVAITPSPSGEVFWCVTFGKRD
jgi:uncharacterized protein YkwD